MSDVHIPIFCTPLFFVPLFFDIQHVCSTNGVTGQVVNHFVKWDLVVFIMGRKDWYLLKVICESINSTDSCINNYIISESNLGKTVHSLDLKYNFHVLSWDNLIDIKTMNNQFRNFT